MKFALAFLAAVALCHAAPAHVKVTSSLHKALANGGTADIMIIMKEKVAPVVASVSSRTFPSSAAKTTAMVAELREVTQASQKHVLNFLKQQTKIKVKSFWITNRISVRGVDLTVVDDLAHNFSDDIEEIREAKVIYLDDTKPQLAPATPNALEWGVQTVQADQAWAQGITGAGVVVSSIDTGVRATHTVLAPGMRANYNWYDGSEAFSQTPTDGNGHGTHTMGSIAGHTGTGVAPGSEWIHCRAFEGGSATEEALTICGQWITCPTLPDGREEDCGQKPSVCSNSWGGGNNDTFYNDIINTWRANNIIPVFAIGNSGPACRTANSPGDQDGVISVSATNAQNLVMSFSSHGPARGGTVIKPECSAPGNNIRSASHLGNNLYIYMSGTSMACPHVAGAVALLLQKKPTATFDEINRALFDTTFRPEFEIICNGGGVNMTNPWPNNSHGWGNIRVNDALAKLQ